MKLKTLLSIVILSGVSSAALAESLAGFQGKPQPTLLQKAQELSQNASVAACSALYVPPETFSAGQITLTCGSADGKILFSQLYYVDKFEALVKWGLMQKNLQAGQMEVTVFSAGGDDGKLQLQAIRKN